MKILHISDCHYEWRTMHRLNALAQARDDCDVVAVTGDVVSKSKGTLPTAWNDWPQPLKIALPGNHGDHSSAFVNLTRWHTTVPWFGTSGDVLFVSAGVEARTLTAAFWEGPEIRSSAARAKAVVVAVHCRPRGVALDLIRRLRGYSPLLIMHGDEHPTGFSGTEWEDSGQGEYRSNVCSSPPYRPDGSVDKGVAHLIEFGSDQIFRAQRVQG